MQLKSLLCAWCCAARNVIIIIIINKVLIKATLNKLLQGHFTQSVAETL